MERITKLLTGIAPALCVECLARVTRLPVDTVRKTTTDLVATGVLIEGNLCPVCGSRSDVLQAQVKA